MRTIVTEETVNSVWAEAGAFVHIHHIMKKHPTDGLYSRKVGEIIVTWQSVNTAHASIELDDVFCALSIFGEGTDSHDPNRVIARLIMKVQTMLNLVNSQFITYEGKDEADTVTGWASLWRKAFQDAGYEIHSVL